MACYIKALIKVTNHPEDFRNGLLYMNELRHYTKCEEVELNDTKEATSAEIRYFNHIFQFVELSDLNKPVFCMYGLYGGKHDDIEGISLPKKMSKFGKYAVIITDVSAFLKKLHSAGLEYSRIFYYQKNANLTDPEYRIRYNPVYRKTHSFRYQSEFRIVNQKVQLVRNSSEKYIDYKNWIKIDDDHTVVNIGDLSDITSEVIPIEQLLSPNKYKAHITINWNEVKSHPLYIKLGNKKRGIIK